MDMLFKTYVDNGAKSLSKTSITIVVRKSFVLMNCSPAEEGCASWTAAYVSARRSQDNLLS